MLYHDYLQAVHMYMYMFKPVDGLLNFYSNQVYHDLRTLY